MYDSGDSPLATGSGEVYYYLNLLLLSNKIVSIYQKCEFVF